MRGDHGYYVVGKGIGSRYLKAHNGMEGSEGPGALQAYCVRYRKRS